MCRSLRDPPHAWSHSKAAAFTGMSRVAFIALPGDHAIFMPIIADDALRDPEAAFRFER